MRTELNAATGAGYYLQCTVALEQALFCVPSIGLEVGKFLQVFKFPVQ